MYLTYHCTSLFDVLSFMHLYLQFVCLHVPSLYCFKCSISVLTHLQTFQNPAFLHPSLMSSPCGPQLFPSSQRDLKPMGTFHTVHDVTVSKTFNSQRVPETVTILTSGFPCRCDGMRDCSTAVSKPYSNRIKTSALVQDYNQLWIWCDNEHLQRRERFKTQDKVLGMCFGVIKEHGTQCNCVAR